MRSGVAPRGEGVFWFLMFWIVMPALAYDRWGGWFGVAAYVLLLAGLFGVAWLLLAPYRRRQEEKP